MTKEADFGCEFLEDIIRWIAVNHDPEALFGKDELIVWASEQDASDILSETQLVAWAESNGFVREE